jgi:hypothetical protein
MNPKLKITIEVLEKITTNLKKWDISSGITHYPVAISEKQFAWLNKVFYMETKMHIDNRMCISTNDVDYGIEINLKSKRFRYIINLFPKTTEKDNELKNKVQSSLK